MSARSMAAALIVGMGTVMVILTWFGGADWLYAGWILGVVTGVIAFALADAGKEEA